MIVLKKKIFVGVWTFGTVPWRASEAVILLIEIVSHNSEIVRQSLRAPSTTRIENWINIVIVQNCHKHPSPTLIKMPLPNLTPNSNHHSLKGNCQNLQKIV